MIDNFALAISHGLLLLATWRLMHMNDVDSDNPKPPKAWWNRDDA
ncbi:hypothetical protein [Aquisediminimonas sediminicola]|nr:hypothetical protein [Aquisediminimonas sediminicola]